MGNRSHGTGSPIAFQCSACRRSKGFGDRFDRMEGSRRGRADRVELTGRMSASKTKLRSYARQTAISREYRCLDCGHVGWSTHVDLEQRVVTMFCEKIQRHMCECTRENIELLVELLESEPVGMLRVVDGVRYEKHPPMEWGSWVATDTEPGNFAPVLSRTDLAIRLICPGHDDYDD